MSAHEALVWFLRGIFAGFGWAISTWAWAQITSRLF